MFAHEVFIQSFIVTGVLTWIFVEAVLFYFKFAKVYSVKTQYLAYVVAGLGKTFLEYVPYHISIN